MRKYAFFYVSACIYHILCNRNFELAGYNRQKSPDIEDKVRLYLYLSTANSYPKKLHFHKYLWIRVWCCLRQPRVLDSTWFGQTVVTHMFVLMPWRHRFIFHITMTSQWALWRLKSPASRLFTQSFIQVHIKENIKAPRHWPLCEEFTGDRWIPRTNGQ